MQGLQLGGAAAAYCPDSAGLSITDNLDIRVRVALDNWGITADEQTFVSKREGGNEWQFRTHQTSGQLNFTWWDTGGVNTSEIPFADTGFENGSVHWIRVKRAGTSVNFWTSDDDTNDHSAVTWTALGATQTTPAGSIRSTVATHVTIGGQGNGGQVEALFGIVYAVAILDNTTVRADPVFADPTQWDVGDDEAHQASDGINTWTLSGGNPLIIGDNVEGASVRVQVAFGTSPFTTAAIWNDITDDVRAISTNRGRNQELDRFDAGIATFEIDNTSGWYHSHNTASPYYPNVRPMVPIRVRAVHGGTIYPIWSGFVERWPVNFPGNIESIATVDAVDLFKPLALADASQPDRAALVDALTPVAWWRFADDTDSSAAGTHDLTITGASTGDAGVWAGDFAGTFDGVDDFATVASEADVELLSDMSLEIWFRPEHKTSATVTTFNSDNTWVCPAGVTAVDVSVWGGGGGGAGGSHDDEGMSGGGGGAGGFARDVVSVTPGVSYTIEVGTAGAAGTGAQFGTDGSAGGSSYFGDFQVRATGGQFGQSADGDGGIGGIGLEGGTLETGGRGGDGRTEDELGGINAAGGGGGGGAGSRTGHGQAGQSMDENLAGGLGGQGGGIGGDGGNGGSPSPTAGSAGSAPGGGGGGGGISSGSASNGGAGAAGRVVLSYVVEAAQVPVSANGATSLYMLQWDGHQLRFLPGTSSGSRLLVGAPDADEWHHAVVTVDWSGSGRTIKGYLNGQLTLEATVAHQPVVESRVVNIGRRANNNDQYFKGAISEIVIYDHILTAQDVTRLHAAQLEGFETQLTGARVEYVLGTAEVGVGVAITDTDLDAGQTVISGPNSPSDEVSALEVIQIAADTEFGSFFIAGDGRPTFQDRYHRLVDMATPVATLDETDYETLHLLGKDDLKVANDVRVAPSDSADPFIVTDTDSKNTYGRRTLELTVYPDNQNEAYDMAVWLLSLFKEPKDDIASIPFRLYEEVTDFATLLAAELGDRYTIDAPLEGDDLALDVYLERISHNIDQVSWTMDWGVTPAGEAETFWLLGVAGFSELGETTVLGF